MIIFHEGLPGSGKSYEAIARRIVPALTAGRLVDAYVEGLDHAKLAALAKITEDKCREQLVALTRDQMAEVHKHCRPNALIVLDEAQNFWGNRARLSEALTQFVTEHRHLGQDIVLMGQDLRDVHAIWRRRVELKLCFLKLSAFGSSGRYSVTTYRHLGGDEYQRVGLVAHKYDKAFFGSYRSHVDDATNTADYKDSRALIWNHWGFRFVAPLLIIGIIWAGSALYRFFSPPKPAQAASSTASAPVSASDMAGAAKPVSAAPVPAAAVVPAADARLPAERHLADLTTNHRIRLVGLISSPTHTTGIVEWVQSGSVVVERLTLDQLRRLGVAVLITGDAVQLAVGQYTALATSWPLEDRGRATGATLERVRGPQPLGAQQELPPGLASLGGARSIDLPGELRGVR